VEPSRRKSSIAIADPKRAKLLNATDAPKFTHSNTDSEEDNLAKPNTENEDPMRA
jgi:hypothetical protein